MLKLLLYFLYVMPLTFFNACGNKSLEDTCKKTPDDPLCIEEQKRKEEQKQINAQQTVKFTNLSTCLKQKKSEAGISEDAKPTSDMVRQCLALTKQ